MANKTKELSAEKLQKLIMEKTMASISEAPAATPSKKETKKTPKAAPAKEAKKETPKKEAKAPKEKKANSNQGSEICLPCRLHRLPLKEEIPSAGQGITQAVQHQAGEAGSKI